MNHVQITGGHVQADGWLILSEFLIPDICKGPQECAFCNQFSGELLPVWAPHHENHCVWLEEHLGLLADGWYGWDLRYSLHEIP